MQSDQLQEPLEAPQTGGWTGNLSPGEKEGEGNPDQVGNLVEASKEASPLLKKVNPEDVTEAIILYQDPFKLSCLWI